MKEVRKKGFTLIELIATVVILSIILSITVPTVAGIINTSYSRAYNMDLTGMEEAAKAYVLYKNVRIDDGSQKIITINEMVEEGIIGSVKDPKSKEDCEGYVTVFNINKKYDFKAYLKCANNYASDDYGEADTAKPLISIIGENPINIFEGAMYSDAGATATDNIDGYITDRIVVSSNININVPGTYKITYTVSDNVGNIASSDRTVRVIDNIAPTITFNPGGNSTYARSRCITVSVNDSGEVDNNSLKYVWTTSAGEPLIEMFTSSFVDATNINTPTLVTGSYYLWIIAMDKIGNQVIKRSEVFNLDNEKPVITINDNINMSINKGSTYVDAGAVVTDSVDTNVELTISSDININQVGTYHVIYNAIDSSGNVADEKIRTVNVLDVSAPTITIVGSNPININVGSTYVDAGATAIDDADGDVTGDIVTTGTVNPNVIGTYIITYTVSDSTGNEATISRTVNIIDNVDPTVIFGINGNATYSQSRSTTVTISDNESGVNTSSLKYLWNTSTTIPAEASFSLSFTNGGTISTPAGVTGGYYLWIMAKDIAGNTAIIRSNVFNLDNTIPVITINGSNPVSVTQGTSYTDAGATATDNIDGNISVNISSTGSVNVNVIGTYTITYNVSDNSGNVAPTATRTINVVEPTVSVNAPALLSGMTPVKWNGSAWIDTNTSDPAWYNYATKKWANVRTSDYSMWVWIPRYVYKIGSGWHTSTTGIIDIQFSQGTNDNWNSAVIGSIDTGTTASASNNKWTDHPAFNFGGTQLTGIWLMKYEATNDLGMNLPQSKPNLPAWVNINVGNAFTYSRGMETSWLYGWPTSGSGFDTHLVKNVEWGAAAYLSKSVYGKNNNEIWINTSNYTTGCASTSASATYTGSCDYTYDTSNGQQASTTGNVYGIYDMSGGAYEYTAAYLNYDGGYFGNGSSIINAATQYKDVYAYSATNTVIYDNTSAKKGDGIYELSGSLYTTRWFSDSNDVGYSTPWYMRGGANGGTTSAGIFASNTDTGSSQGNRSFRAALLVNAGL